MLRSLIEAQLAFEGEEVVIRRWAGCRENEHQVVDPAVLISWGIVGYQASGEANAAERGVEKDLDKTKALFVRHSYFIRAAP